MRKDFMISDGSVLAIEDNGNRKVFLKVAPDGSGMIETTYTEFIEYFKSLAHLCITSWNTELVDRYRDFYKAIQEALYDN